MPTKSDDPAKDKVVQQLLKALTTARNLATHLNDVMKTLFTAAEQLNDAKISKTIIRDGLVQRYNDAIQIQRTIQASLNNAPGLQRAVYGEEQAIDDYLIKAKLDICLKEANDFLRELD